MTDEPPRTTTDAGSPVASDEFSLTVGPDGPILLQDQYLIEQMANFNRERIPERQRTALLLAELHDLTGLELAAALGVSHVAARALLTRARESLRQALAVEREVGHDVGTRPAGELGRLGILGVGERVDRADERSIGSGDGVRVGSRDVDHPPIVPLRQTPHGPPCRVDDGPAVGGA